MHIFTNHVVHTESITVVICGSCLMKSGKLYLFEYIFSKCLIEVFKAGV